MVVSNLQKILFKKITGFKLETESYTVATAHSNLSNRGCNLVSFSPSMILRRDRKSVV